MKKYLITFIVSFFCVTLFAQVPEGINFQGIARDKDGKILKNTEIMLQLTIIDSTKNAKKTEYQEYRYAKTNDYGSMSFKVGINPFTVKTGEFKNVNWKNGHKKLKVEIATQKNGNFDIDLGEMNFATVPFAYNADNVSYINPANAQDGDILVYNATSNMFEA